MLLSQPTIIDSYIVKPITASIIFDEMMRLLGQSYALTSSRYNEKSVLDEVKKKLSGCHILLVEDNELNQELAIALLQDVGVSVSLSENGSQAIELASLNSFDGILMDLQMPVMDGYTATGVIRQEQPHIPIIAMTANALAEDKDKVIKAGMTAHLSKPINVEDMYTTLSKWIKPSGVTQVITLPEHEQNIVSDIVFNPLMETEFSYINTEAGLKTCNSDERLYLRLLRKFMVHQQGFTEQFNEAWAEQHIKDAQIIAHTLKGTAGNLGALLLMNQAGALEKACVEPIANEVIQTEFHHCRNILDNVLFELNNYFKTIDHDNLIVQESVKVNLIDEIDNFKSLYKSLEMSDTDALGFAEPIAEKLAGTPLLTCFNKIVSRVDEYDFDTALALLKEFIK